VAAAAKSFAEDDQRPLKLYFEDEARFGRMYDPVYCWAPKGSRPLVRLQRVRQYTHVYSASCPKDGDTFSLILPYANTEMMTLFLQHFSQHCQDYRVVIVMDGAAWHKAEQLTWFDNIRIIYQPANSPELNPVEHLWEHLREKYFANCFWSTMAALEKALERALLETSQQKEIIQSLVGFHWAIV
jgi:transposase